MSLENAGYDSPCHGDRRRRKCMERLISALGLAVFIGLSYAFSINRRAVLWRSVLWGLGLEFFFALLILKTPGGLAKIHEGGSEL